MENLNYNRLYNDLFGPEPGEIRVLLGTKVKVLVVRLAERKSMDEQQEDIFECLYVSGETHFGLISDVMLGGTSVVHTHMVVYVSRKFFGTDKYGVLGRDTFKMCLDARNGGIGDAPGICPEIIPIYKAWREKTLNQFRNLSKAS